MVNQTYKNRVFSLLGDSISTLEGYNPPECAVFYDWQNRCLSDVLAPSDTWWGRVIDTLGGDLLVNNSWSGSLVCKHPDCEIESYGCSDARTSALGIGNKTPDVIMILMGLNDFGYGMRIEQTDDTGDLSVFGVAYDSMLKKLKTNYPEAEIWCLTLPVGYLSRQPDFVPILKRSGGTLSDYCRVIEKCAERNGCKTIGIYEPENPYDTVDGYHPTASGMKTIADAVLKQI